MGWSVDDEGRPASVIEGNVFKGAGFKGVAVKGGVDAVVIHGNRFLPQRQSVTRRLWGRFTKLRESIR